MQHSFSESKMFSPSKSQVAVEGHERRQNLERSTLPFVDREALRSATINTLDTLKNRLTEEFRAKFEAMTRDAELSSARMYELETYLVDAKERYHRLSSVKDRVISSLEVERDRLADLCESYRSDLEVKEQELSSKCREIEAITSERASLLAENEHLASKLSSADDRIALLEGQPSSSDKLKSHNTSASSVTVHGAGADRVAELEELLAQTQRDLRTQASEHKSNEAKLHEECNKLLDALREAKLLVGPQVTPVPLLGGERRVKGGNESNNSSSILLVEDVIVDNISSVPVEDISSIVPADDDVVTDDTDNNDDEDVEEETHRDEREQLSHDFLALLAENEGLHVRLSVLESELQVVATNRLTEVNDLTEKIEGLQKEVEAKGEENSGLLTEVNELTEKIEGLKKEVDAKGEENSGLLTEVNELTVKIEGLQKDVEAKGEENSELLTEVNELTVKIEGLQKEVDAKGEENSGLLTEVNELTEKIEGLKKEVEAKGVVNSDLENTCEEQRSRIAVLDDSLGRFLIERRDTNHNHHHDQEELSRLTAVADARTMDLEIRLLSLHQEVQSKMAENEELQATCGGLRKRVTELEQQQQQQEDRDHEHDRNHHDNAAAAVAVTSKEVEDLQLQLLRANAQLEVNAAEHLKHYSILESKSRLLQADLEIQKSEKVALQDTCNELHAQLTQLGEALERAQIDSSSVAAKQREVIAQLQREVDEKSKRLTDSQTDVDMTRTDLEYLSDSKLGELEQLESDLQASILNVEQLQKDLQSQKQESQQYADSCVKLRGQVSELADALEALQVQSQRSTIKFLERIRDLQRELDVSRSDAAAAVSATVTAADASTPLLTHPVDEAANLRAEVDALRAALTSTQATLTASTHTFTTRISELQRELESRTREASQVKDEAAMTLSDLEYVDQEKYADIASLTEKLEVCDGVVRKLRVSLRGKEDANRVLLSANRELERRIADLSDDLECSREETVYVKSTLTERLRDLKDEAVYVKSTLTERLRDLKDEVLEKEEEADLIHKEVDMTLSDLQYTDEEKVGSLQEQLQQRSDEVHYLEAELEEVREELERVQDKLDRALSASAAVSAAVSAPAPASASASSSNQIDYTAQEKGSQNPADKIAMEQKLVHLQSALTVKSDELAEAQTTIRSLRSSIRELEERSGDESTIRSELIREVAKLRAQVTHLRTELLRVETQLEADYHSDSDEISEEVEQGEGEEDGSDGETESNAEEDKEDKEGNNRIIKDTEISLQRLQSDRDHISNRLAQLESFYEANIQELTQEKSALFDALQAANARIEASRKTEQEAINLHTDLQEKYLALLQRSDDQSEVIQQVEVKIQKSNKKFATRIEGLDVQLQNQVRDSLAAGVKVLKLERLLAESESARESFQKQFNELQQQQHDQVVTDVSTAPPSTLAVSITGSGEKNGSSNMTVAAFDYQQLNSMYQGLTLEFRSVSQELETAKAKLLERTDALTAIEKTLSGVQEENSRMQKDLEAVEEALDAAKDYIVELEERVDDAETRLEAALVTDEQASMTYDKLRKQMQAGLEHTLSLEESLAELQQQQQQQQFLPSTQEKEEEELTFIISERNALREELDSSRIEIDMLRGQVEEQAQLLQQGNDIIASISGKYADKVSELQAELASTAAKTQEVSSTAVASDSDIDQHHHGVSQLEQLVRELTQDNLTLRMTLEKSMDDDESVNYESSPPKKTSLSAALPKNDVSSTATRHNHSTDSNEIAVLQQRLEESRQLVEEYQSECDDLMVEVNSLEGEVASRNRDIEVLKGQLKSKTEEAQSVTAAAASDLDSIQHERDLAVSRLTDLELLYDSTADQLSEAKASLRDLSLRLDKTTMQSNEATEAFAAELAEREEEVVELQRHIATVEEGLARYISAEDDSAALRVQLSQSQDTVTREREAVSNLREEIKVLQEVAVLNSALQSELLKTQQDLAKEKGASAGLLGELASLQAQAGTMVQERDVLRDELEVMAERLAVLEDDLSEEQLLSHALREERDELLNRTRAIATLEEEKIALSHRWSDERELVQRISKDAKSAKGALSEAKDRMQELESLLDEQRSNHADVIAECQVLRDSSHDLTYQVAEVEVSLQEERQLRKHSEEQVEDYKRELESNEEYYGKIQRQLEGDIDGRQKRIVELEEDCAVLRGEVRELNHKVETLEVELDRLTEEHQVDLVSTKEINNAMIEATIVRNDHEITKLKGLLDRKCGETTALNVRIYKLDRVMQSLQVERGMLVDQVTILDRTCEVKSVELTRLRGLVDDIKSRIASLDGEEDDDDDEFVVADDDY